VSLLRKSNGQDPEEQQRRHEDIKTGQTGLQVREQDDPSDKTDLLEELSEFDRLDEIDDDTLRMLATKDIPTSNVDEADVAEFRGFMDVARMKKRARYPDEGQDVTGVWREVIHDDVEAGLQPVGKGDLLADEAFFQTMKARVLKAKNADLVTRVLSSIRVSKVDRGGGDGGGRLLSRLRN